MLGAASPTANFSWPGSLPKGQLPSSEVGIAFLVWSVLGNYSLRLVGFFCVICGHLIRRLRSAQDEVVPARVPITHVIKAHFVRSFRYLVGSFRFHLHALQDRGFRRFYHGLLVDRENVGFFRVVRRLLFKWPRLIFQFIMDANCRVFRVPFFRWVSDDLRDSGLVRANRVGAVVVEVARL